MNISEFANDSIIEERLNLPFLALVFLIPLQNIYIGKIPSFGGGFNVLNILMVFAIVSAVCIRGTRFGNSMNMYLYLLLSGYLLSMLQSTNERLLYAAKDLFVSYLFFFVAYKSITGMKAMKAMFWASVLPLPYMFKVFYSNLSWMGFSTYKDKLRSNSGTFMELGSNEIAAFYATYTIILIAIAVQEKDRRLRWLLYLASGMNVYCLVYSFSRGAYLSSMMALLVFAFLSGKIKKLVFGLLLILFMSFFGAQVLPNAVKERFDSTFSSEEERDESAQSRIILWDIAMDKFAENPIMGIGFGNFKKVNSYGKDTHNYYVKMLVEGGIIGFLFLVVFLLAALRRGIQLFQRANDPFLKALATGFIACMVAMLVGNFFGDRFTHYPLISYFFVYLAMVVKGLEWSTQSHEEADTSPALN